MGERSRITAADPQTHCERESTLRPRFQADVGGILVSKNHSQDTAEVPPDPPTAQSFPRPGNGGFVPEGQGGAEVVLPSWMVQHGRGTADPEFHHSYCTRPEAF